jgi:hypothetical protein
MGLEFLKFCFQLAVVSLICFHLVARGQQIDKPPAEQKPSAPFSDAAPNLSSSDLFPHVKEDFSTPALNSGTQLLPQHPLALESDDFDSFHREIVRVEWRPGDSIDLYIVKPLKVSKPPVVLYLYSYPFEMDRFRNSDFCNFLVQSGVAAVGFPSALTGTRYRSGRPMKEWFVSELPESLATTSHDVQMILNYLGERGDFDMNRVGMFGDGSGATIAILTAAVDSRIKALDLLDPWGDWPDWVAKSTRIPENERPNFLKPEWLSGVASLDPLLWLPKLKTQKVRIRLIRDVSVTPADIQDKIAAVSPPDALIVKFKDFSDFQESVVRGAGFDWIKQQVRGKGPRDYHTARRPKSQSSRTTLRSSQQ